MRVLIGVGVVATAYDARAADPVPYAVMPKNFIGAPCSSTPGVPVGGRKFYVSPTGNDNNNGRSMATAYKTISHSVAGWLVQPGDVILVAPGTYNELVEIGYGGTPGACVTLMGIPGQPRPVVTWSNDTYATINVWAPYVRVSGLKVTHPEPNLKPKSISNPGNSAIDVYSAGAPDSSGVFRPTVHHVQIDNNEAFGSGCGGISFEGVDYVLAYGNTVYGNAYSKSGHCSGISFYESLNLDNAPGYHQYIIDNYSYGNINLYPVVGPSYTTDESGIIFDDGRNSQRKAVSPNLNILPYSGHTLIFGNVMFGNGGHAVEIYTSDYVDVFNNVGYGDLTDSELKNYPNCPGELYAGYSGHLRFENNIVVASSSNLQVLSQLGAAVDQASNLWKNNIADVGKISLGAPNSGNANAAALYGVNPEFVSPSLSPIGADRNFQLQWSSPAWGASAPLSVTVTDIAGSTVPAGGKLNIGAYIR